MPRIAKPRDQRSNNASTQESWFSGAVMLALSRRSTPCIHTDMDSPMGSRRLKPGRKEVREIT